MTLKYKNLFLEVYLRIINEKVQVTTKSVNISKLEYM